jgi:hypothetical protein
MLFMDKFYGKIATNFVMHNSFINGHFGICIIEK